MSTPPTIGPVTLDQDAYRPGTTITASVPYANGTADDVELISAGQAQRGDGTAGVLEVTFTSQAVDPAGVTAGGPVEWVQQPTLTSPAVFTATAPASSFTATFTVTGAGSGLDASADVDVTVTPPPPVFGAALGPVTSTSPSIPAWVVRVGRPMAVRHYFAGRAFWPTCAASPFSGEVGVRKALIDFEPALDGSDAQALDACLGALSSAGLDVDVTIYHASPSKPGFAQPSDYWAAVARYVPVVVKHAGPSGPFRHIFDLNSWQAIHQNLWATWWPGGEVQVDAAGLEYYQSAYQGGQRLDGCAAFIDTWNATHGTRIGFGLCEFGVDFRLPGDRWLTPVTEAQGLSVLTYVHDFFAARIAAGKPQYDIVMWNDIAGQTDPGIPVTAQPVSWMAKYQALADLLAGAS